MKKDADRLEWIANDYVHLAQDADGKVDALRRKQYRWLMKLVNKLAGDGQRRKQGKIDV
jgi:hypothetical protein